MSHLKALMKNIPLFKPFPRFYSNFTSTFTEIISIYNLGITIIYMCICKYFLAWIKRYAINNNSILELKYEQQKISISISATLTLEMTQKHQWQRCSANVVRIKKQQTLAISILVENNNFTDMDALQWNLIQLKQHWP